MSDQLRPEWLATIDDTITLLNGMGRYGIVTRLVRLRKGLAALHVTDTPARHCPACVASITVNGQRKDCPGIVAYDASMADSHSPAHSDTPDVARLARAWANVMDGRRIGTGPNAARISGGTTNADDWQAIAAEYARSPRPSAIG